MALIVAPLADYNSLASVAFADAYLASVGEVTWAAATNEQKEIHLVRGTQYVIGRRIRSQHIAPTVHVNVAQAACEAAIRSLAGTLYKDLTKPAVVAVTVGPISKRYAEDKRNGRIGIPVIDDLLRGLTGGIYDPFYLERV